VPPEPSSQYIAIPVAVLDLPCRGVSRHDAVPPAFQLKYYLRRRAGMKLTNVKITNYKSIEDSEEFSVGQLTCLAGKNESGKTAILQALRRLNPVEDSEAVFDRTMEFPRRRLHDSDEGGERVLDTTWELDDVEVAKVEAVLGAGAVASRTVHVRKSYGTQITNWTVEIDEPKVIAALAKASHLTAAATERVSKAKSVAALNATIAGMGDKATVGEKALTEKIAKFREGRPTLAAIDVLSPLVPKFLYFDTYEAMPGRVGVEELNRKQADGEELDQGERIFLALLARSTRGRALRGADREAGGRLQPHQQGNLHVLEPEQAPPCGVRLPRGAGEGPRERTCVPHARGEHPTRRDRRIRRAERRVRLVLLVPSVVPPDRAPVRRPARDPPG
jgi:hypothetical protein